MRQIKVGQLGRVCSVQVVCWIKGSLQQVYFISVLTYLALVIQLLLWRLISIRRTCAAGCSDQLSSLASCFLSCCLIRKTRGELLIHRNTSSTMQCVQRPPNVESRQTYWSGWSFFFLNCEKWTTTYFLKRNSSKILEIAAKSQRNRIWFSVTRRGQLLLQYNIIVNHIPLVGFLVAVRDN